MTTARIMSFAAACRTTSTIRLSKQHTQEHSIPLGCRKLRQLLLFAGPEERTGSAGPLQQLVLCVPEQHVGPGLLYILAKRLNIYTPASCAGCWPTFL